MHLHSITVNMVTFQTTYSLHTHTHIQRNNTKGTSSSLNKHPNMGFTVRNWREFQHLMVGKVTKKIIEKKLLRIPKTWRVLKTQLVGNKRKTVFFTLLLFDSFKSTWCGVNTAQLQQNLESRLRMLMHKFSCVLRILQKIRQSLYGKGSQLSWMEYLHP